MKQDKEILDTMVNFANQLLVSGLDVSKVEAMTVKLGKSFGMIEVDVFVITSTIIITIKNINNETFTQTKRVRNYRTDFAKIEYLCELFEMAISEQWDIEEIKNSLKDKSNSIYHSKKILYMGIAAIFTLFFCGNIWEAAVSAMCGVIMCSVMEGLVNLVNSRFLIQMLTAFSCGVVASLFVLAGIITSVDKVIIGNIMLLIPGLSLVNAIKDLIGEELITGLLRLFESLVVTLAISFGIILTYIIF